MSHHHLSRDERVILAALLRAGHRQAECSRIPGVHQSTIGRELQRSPLEYRVVTADRAATLLRRESKERKRVIENNTRLEKSIMRLLKKGYSPEQISEEVKSVSDDAIYARIKRSPTKNWPFFCLREAERGICMERTRDRCKDGRN